MKCNGMSSEAVVQREAVVERRLQRLARSSLVGLAVLASLAASAAAQCDLNWARTGTAPGSTPIGFFISATKLDPDGPGPLAERIYLGGPIPEFGGMPGGGFGSFGRDSWRPEPTPGDGFVVEHLTTWDPDGTGPLPNVIAAGLQLVVAEGEFDVFNYNRFSVFDGTSWQTLGSPQEPGIALSICAWDPDDAGPRGTELYAVRTTGLVEPSPAEIVRWTGSAWQRQGDVFSGSGRLFVFDDGPGGLPTSLLGFGGVGNLTGIVRWNGSSWEQFANSAGAVVNSLSTWDADGNGPERPSLLITASGVVAGIEYVGAAAWNGSNWRSLNLNPGDAGLFGPLFSWDHDTDPATPARLVGGGGFQGEAPNQVRLALEWNGSNWVRLGNGAFNLNGFVSAFTAFDHDGNGQSDLHAFGLQFYGPNAGSSGFTYDGAARFDGTNWLPLGTGFGGRSQGATYWDHDGNGPAGESLIVVGQFRQFGDRFVGGVARREGDGFVPVNGDGSSGIEGVNGTVVAVTTWDPDGDGPLPASLVVGGGFSAAGGAPATNVAILAPGGTWQPLGDGLTGPFGGVQALESWDPDGDGPLNPVLLAGGRFDRSGTRILNYVAAWNGTQWIDLDGGMSRTTPGGLASVNDLFAWDADGSGPATPMLVAGGLFDLAGGVSAPKIATWNGESWAAIEGSLPQAPGVFGISAWDADQDGSSTLVVAARRLYTLEPEFGWSLVSPTPSIESVTSVIGWDPDGCGPRGEELVIGGIPRVLHLTDSGVWDNMDGGVFAPSVGGAEEPRNILGIWDPDATGPQSARVLVGGAIGYAGDYGSSYVPSSGFAMYGCSTPCSCPADFNGDEQIDFFDYLDFVASFSDELPAADFNGDGQVDFFDYLDFVQAFGNGC
ncbi:MAG: GC-type dockerin domain-anchored protein [Planctomycetota bacterium]|nr:GC-type dockerin domain-anchored protein [Planctomycetota bacterium]